MQKKLIDEAKKAGFSAVKFQTYLTDDLVIKNTNLVKYQNKTNFHDMKSLLNNCNLTFNDFEKLKNYCKIKKIIFLSTPFDIKSAIFLNQLNLPAFKVSSGDFDNHILINLLKKFNKPLILSTGMSNLKEIKKNLKIFKIRKNNLILLHCVSDYPTSIKNSNLNNIPKIENLGYLTGYSDHTIGEICSSIAVFLGATVIEKHITIDTKMKGPDHSSSLPINELKSFINNLNLVKKSYLVKSRKLTNEEKITIKKSRKSLYFSKDLKKDLILKPNDLIALRSNSIGISPIKYKKIIGSKLKQKVKKNYKVKFKYFYEK